MRVLNHIYRAEIVKFWDVNARKLFMVQLADVRAELERINAENQRLRVTLNQVNSNYYALQMHLVSLMQQQRNRRAESSEATEVKLQQNYTINNLSFCLVSIVIISN